MVGESARARARARERERQRETFKPGKRPLLRQPKPSNVAVQRQDRGQGSRGASQSGRAWRSPLCANRAAVRALAYLLREITAFR